MRLALAFFKRDAAIALSYRFSFAMQFLSNLLVLVLLYYIGETVGSQELPVLKRYGGNFFAYVVIGVALSDCVLVSLISFANQVREGQTTGTLEATLMSPLSLPTILIFSSIWDYFLSAFRFLFYIFFGIIIYDLNMGRADITSALLIFLLTVLCFMGIGIFCAGIILLLKRGETIMMILRFMIILLTGVFFPVALLPDWMQKIAVIIPLTSALEGMRFALLLGAGIQELFPIISKLALLAAIMMGIGITGFNLAVKMAKQTGSLTQY